MKHEDQSFSSFLHILKRHARSAMLAALRGPARNDVFRVRHAGRLPVIRVAADRAAGGRPRHARRHRTAREYVEQRLQRATSTRAHARNCRRSLSSATSSTRTMAKQPCPPKKPVATVYQQRRGDAAGHRRDRPAIDARRRSRLRLRRRLSGTRTLSSPATSPTTSPQLFIASSSEQTQADAERGHRLPAHPGRPPRGRPARARSAAGGVPSLAMAAGSPRISKPTVNGARDLERDLARVDDDLREPRAARKDLLEAQLRDTAAHAARDRRHRRSRSSAAKTASPRRSRNWLRRWPLQRGPSGCAPVAPRDRKL